MKSKLLIYFVLILIVFADFPVSAQSFGGKKTKSASSKKLKIPRKESVEKSILTDKIVKEKVVKSTPKKKGILSKIGDAATRGYGWQLGKEAAKETIKGVKKIANSESVKKIKYKTVETTNQLLKKDEK
jgi:hypothetical protein